MNKILVGSVLLILAGISVSLYFDSKKETGDNILSVKEKTEKPSEAKVDVNKDVVIKDKENILDLSGKSLTKAPAYIFENTNLKELNLSNNKIGGSLQAEVRLLENLRVLDLSNNNFTGVPAEVAQLENLEVLNLANNRLTGLPMELGNLKNIQRIDLRGNTFAKQDLDSIKSKLPATVVILVD